MKSLEKLSNRIISSLDFFELLLLSASLFIGSGLVYNRTKSVTPDMFFQSILFFVILEIGMQIFQISKEYPKGRDLVKDVEDQKNIVLLISVLFFGLSILPLFRIMSFNKSSIFIIYIISIIVLLKILRSYIWERPYGRSISIFVISLNNAFFLPLLQISLFNLVIDKLFMTFSQILFFSNLGSHILREIYQIEIKNQSSTVIKLFGTLPSLQVSLAAYFTGLCILAIYSLLFPSTAIILLLLISSAIIGLMIYLTTQVHNLGRPGLLKIFHFGTLLLVIQYLGVGFYLWIY